MFQKIHDLAELAKAGYKPNDIKELLELANTIPEKAADDSSVETEAPDSNKSSEPEASAAEDPLEAIIKRNEGE